MRRKIYTELLKWKEEEAGRTALLIDGARRVGKSYIVENFAKFLSLLFYTFSKFYFFVFYTFSRFLFIIFYTFSRFYTYSHYTCTDIVNMKENKKEAI